MITNLKNGFLKIDIQFCTFYMHISNMTLCKYTDFNKLSETDYCIKFNNETCSISEQEYLALEKIITDYNEK